MLNKRITSILTHRGYQIICTQGPDLPNYYVIFEQEQDGMQNYANHIVFIGRYESSSKNVISEVDLKHLIDHLLTKPNKEVKQ